MFLTTFSAFQIICGFSLPLYFQSLNKTQLFNNYIFRVQPLNAMIFLDLID